MPYGGTSPEEDKKIEDCVQTMLNQRNFKSSSSQGSRKTSAIAICKAHIMGSEKVMIDGKKYTKEGYLIVAENVPVKFSSKIEYIKEKEDTNGTTKN